MKSPRELVIEYGSFVVSSVLGREIDDRYSVGLGQDVGFFEFSFRIHLPDEASFVSAANAVETAFRTPRQQLEVTLGASVIHDFDPDDAVNTGFNHRPFITKRLDIPVDSGRSRRFFVRIDFDLPADVYSQDGRRDSRVDITFNPARVRVMTLISTWTAVDAEGSARAQMDANLQDYIDTQTTSAGGVWEKIDESQEADTDDKVIESTVVMREVNSQQSSSGAPDDPDLFNHVVAINGLKEAPGDTPLARRLRQIGVSYSVFAIKGTDLRAKYKAVIRDFLINTALNKFGAANGAVVLEDPKFDDQDSRIEVVMRILAPIDNSARIEFILTTEITDEFGLVFLAAWTGDPLSYHEFQGPAKKIRTVTARERRLGNVGIPASAGAGAVGAAFIFPGGQVVQGFAGGGGGAGGPGAIGAIFQFPPPGGQQQQQGLPDECDFRPVMRRVARTPIRLGTPSHFIDVTDLVTTTVEQCIKSIGGGFPSTPTQSAGGPGGP